MANTRLFASARSNAPETVDTVNESGHDPDHWVGIIERLAL